MVTDNELLADVRAVLHDEVADVTASPALLAAVRRKHRRLRAVRRMVWVTPVAVATVAAVVVLWPRTGISPHLATPEPANAAHVKQRTSEALDDRRNDVVYERAVAADGNSRPGEVGLYERWLAADGSAFRFRASVAGEPVVDFSRDAVSDVFVDYRTRTYRARPGTEPTAPELHDVWTPNEIQLALGDGRIRVVGPGEAICDRATVKLRREERKATPPMDVRGRRTRLCHLSEACFLSSAGWLADMFPPSTA